MQQLRKFALPSHEALNYQASRADDLYVSLVGELFAMLNNGEPAPADLASIANALLPFTTDQTPCERVDQRDAAILAAASFYLGGYPASAYLTARQFATWNRERDRACFELMARPRVNVSESLGVLIRALEVGDLSAVESLQTLARADVDRALQVGPDEWVSARLMQSLLDRFARTNLRAVLPDGSSARWTPLIQSLVRRGILEFFPSQIEAIGSGLLGQAESRALQMPTGAGKTALCETLLFAHATSQPGEVAVLLVPLRALASELRATLVQRLIEMGITARCAYAGTVPRGAESDDLDETQVLVATPESLSGLLSANRLFARRISLVICDEGHLLDASGRGVGLELLLSRLKARRDRAQRFVFVSAIVPNMEEISTWLGGDRTAVIRSDYRPALAEFAVLRSSADNPGEWDMEMHPGESTGYIIQRFLDRRDFVWTNPASGRRNSHSHRSIKAVAVATARKALPMGTVIVFAANKSGGTGAIGLAEELILQVERHVPLPNPVDFADETTCSGVMEYLNAEFGPGWVGTRAFKSGAVLHHGDLPQEVREVLESALRRGAVRLGICTSTLAEGVNLPVRTLILYSVRRLRPGGQEDLLTRDIKNLVGRTGRAGASTRGLVICANEAQWPLVQAVAKNARGEPVRGALSALLRAVRNSLAANRRELDNDLLERAPGLFGLIDGIDYTLVDLAALEIGDDEFRRLALGIAEETLAWKHSDDSLRGVLREVVELRAGRVSGYRSSGKLQWIRDTGARVRMIEPVESGLKHIQSNWDDAALPSLDAVFEPLVGWAMSQSEVVIALQRSLRLERVEELKEWRPVLMSLVRIWMEGASYREIAESLNIDIDLVLHVLSQPVGFALQSLLEQAVSLLAQSLRADGRMLSGAVARFPNHLRFGVWTAAGTSLAEAGVRHRRAYVALGKVWESEWPVLNDVRLLATKAREAMVGDVEEWLSPLGSLVLEHTMADLDRIVHARSRPQ
jgi:hypothetical protein